MRKIDIETLNVSTMTYESSGSVILEDDGVVRFEGMNERSIREYYDHGAVGLGRHGILYPKDGARFMEALVLETNRTSFVRAVEVKS